MGSVMAEDREDLSALLDAYISEAHEYIEQEIDPERAEALEAYLGAPDGTEQEGYSQARSQDVEEVVEWILPSIVDSFMIPEPVRLVPQSPADVEQAKAETEAVRYTLFKENPGFLILYQWFKDALLQKNGIVRVVENDNATGEQVEMADLTEIEAQWVASTLQDAEVVPQEDGRFTVTGRRMSATEAPVVVEVIPPEQFLVAADWDSLRLDDCPFVAYFRDVTASELRSMGFDDSLVEEALAAGDEEEAGMDAGRTARRFSDGAAAPIRRRVEELDDSQKTVTLYEAFVLTDQDGDGIAERHRVLYAGGVVLSDEVVDDQPFVAITPSILSHRFWGRSVADQVLELQRIKTAILRQTLDNLYLANRPQRVVLDGAVNMKDLQAPAIDRIIRVTTPDAIQHVATPFVAGQSLPILQYIDKMRESRTGVGPTYTGQSYELSTQTAHGVERMMSAAEQKVRLIARVFAEVGLREVYLKIHRLLRRLQVRRMIELDARWVTMDAGAWRERSALEAKVGLGHAARAQQAQALLMLYQAQQQIASSGGMGILVDPVTMYRTLVDMARAAGLDQPEQYFIDPSQPEVQMLTQQRMAKPDKDMMQLQLESQKAMIDAQLKAKQLELETAKLATDTDANQIRLQGEIDRLRAQQAVLQQRLEAEKTRAVAAVETAKAKAAQQLIEAEQRQLKGELDVERQKMQLDAERMKAEARAQQLTAQIRLSELQAARQLQEMEMAMAKQELEASGSATGGAPDILVEQHQKMIGEVEGLRDLLAGPRKIEHRDDGMPARVVYPDGSYREVQYDKDGQAVGLGPLMRGEASNA